MSRKKLEKRFVIAVILSSVINLLVLLAFIIFKIKPIFQEIRHYKDDIINVELKTKYDNLDDLIKDVEIISNKYDLTINIEDVNEKRIIDNNVKANFPLINKIIITENNSYILKIYFNNNISITKLTIELLIIQSIVIALTYAFIFIYTRHTLIKPIGDLMDDIKNYKFGRKLKKKKLNNEIDLISNEISNLTSRLDEEKNEQTRIIASISHDIKTPLTSIIGYSKLIKEENLNNEISNYNDKIYSKAMNIKDILLSFDEYLLNKENNGIKKTNILINDIIKELKDDYKIELNNKNIDFIITSKLKEQYINVDITKLKRVFSNIISNSVRYLKTGGVIKIEIKDNSNDFIFIISDSGPGVNDKIINKIFNPLFTTDSSRKISGLGLSICKEFIEMHNGHIEAYNKSGLVIKFTIPKEK